MLLRLVTLAEFHELSREDQGLSLWAVLLHDIDKRMSRGADGKVIRDPSHPFRCAAVALRILCRVCKADIAGTLLEGWAADAKAAMKLDPDGVKGHDQNILIHDNRKLPGLVDRLHAMPLHRSVIEVVLVVML